MSDRLDKRTLKLLQLANELVRKYSNPALEESYKRIRLAILDYGIPTNQRDLAKLEREISAIFIEAANTYFAEMTDELYQLSALESAFAASISREVIKAESLAVKITPTAKEKAEQYVKGSVMHLHSGNNDFVGTYDELLNGLTTGNASRVNAIIKGAWLQQSNGVMQSPQTVINRVKAVMDNANKQYAEGLVRTAVTHFSTQGREAFRKDNSNVIEREVPIVTFDNRVSKTCVSIAAKYGKNGWPEGKSPIGYPPYHPNCRTAIGFLLKGQKELYGTRQSIQGKKGEVAEEKFEAKKERRDGKVVKYSGRKDPSLVAREIPANTPIEKFLRDQPEWFVRDVLKSKKLADAFLAGELDLRKITDRDLAPRTLEQIGIE